MSLFFQNGSYARGLDQWATPNPKQATSGASRTSLNPQRQSASQSPDERVTQPTPGKSLDMSSYRPGQAQPVQQQSRGTPYGQSATNQPFTNAPATPQSYQDSAYGKFANSQGFFQQPVGPSLAPFQMSAAQTPWGPSMDPFVERDAIIRALNEQRMQRQVAFNTGGPAPVNAGAMPWLDYGAAIQQAGLGQGSPSMSQGSGDSLIERLNQQFGQPAPTAYYPGFNPQTQNPYGQPGPHVEWLPPTLNGYGGRGQQAAPGYGTPPEKRGLGRTANWIDKDRDGVDDRDQDGPGLPHYERQGQAQSIQPPSQGTPYRPQPEPSPPAAKQPSAIEDPTRQRLAMQYGDRLASLLPSTGTLPDWAVGSPLDTPGITWRDWGDARAPAKPTAPPPPESAGLTPAPAFSQAPKSDDPRQKFLYERKHGAEENRYATYNDYVNSQLRTNVNQLANSARASDLVSRYVDAATPEQRETILENLTPSIFLGPNMPTDDWLQRKTGLSAPAARRKYAMDALDSLRSAAKPIQLPGYKPKPHYFA